MPSPRLHRAARWLRAKHARTTTRLAQTHLAIGSALGGEAGARLAAKTAVPTSPDTLLRRVKQAGAQSPGDPKFVGIDDWAWCKGQRYGTIVVDLETNEVIDLLPNRDAVTVGTWLAAHPASNWSAATARRLTPRRPPRARPRRSKSPIDGIS